jgi:hypothetical protein
VERQFQKMICLHQAFQALSRSQNQKKKHLCSVAERLLGLQLVALG